MFSWHTCVLCYIVAESYKNDHILEQTFKTIEHRLDEERSKQFDDFKRTTKKQTAIFRHTITNNQKTFAEKTNTIAEWIVPHVVILSNQIAGMYLLRYLAYHRRHVVITSVKLKQ